MKLPILRQILLTSSSYDHIREVLDQNEFIGEGPCYIELDDIEMLDKADTFIKNLHFLLFERHINPFFPYPIFLISKKIGNSSYFPIIRDAREIPKYFIFKSKQLALNEQSLLYKIENNIEKMKFMDLEIKMKFLKDNAWKKRRLYHLCLENVYYEKICPDTFLI